MSLVDKIQSAKPGMFFLIGVFLGAAYYFSNSEILDKKDREIGTAKAAISKAEEEVKEAQKIASDKKKFEEEVNHVSDQLKAALEFLPTRLNEQEVIQKITNEARSAGVNASAIQPKKPQTKGFYEEILMEVEMDGSYTQLVQFLAYISKIQRIVNIRGLDLSVKEFTDEVPILKLKGTLVAYRYVEGK